MHNSSNTNVVNNVSIPVTVNVEDVNDNPPKFKQGKTYILFVIILDLFKESHTVLLTYQVMF